MREEGRVLFFNAMIYLVCVIQSRMLFGCLVSVYVQCLLLPFWVSPVYLPTRSNIIISALFFFGFLSPPPPHPQEKPHTHKTKQKTIGSLNSIANNTDYLFIIIISFSMIINNLNTTGANGIREEKNPVRSKMSAFFFFFFFFFKKLEHKSIENLAWGIKQFFLLNSIPIHVAMISFLPGSPLIYVKKCWRHARSSLLKVLKHSVWNCCSGFRFLFSLTKPIYNLLVSSL